MDDDDNDNNNNNNKDWPTARSNGHSDTFSSNFFPSPSGSLIPRVKKITIIILNPFEGGRSLTWDVTVVCSTADSCIDLAIQGQKYATLQTHYDFQLIAVDTLRPIKESTTSLLHDLGRRISLVNEEEREPQLLFQRISVAIQRFNAVLLHDGFFVVRPPGLVSTLSLSILTAIFQVNVG